MPAPIAAIVCRTTAGAWKRRTGERESGTVVVKDGGEKEDAFVRVCARLCAFVCVCVRWPPGPTSHIGPGLTRGLHHCRRQMPSISKSVCLSVCLSVSTYLCILIYLSI